MHVAERCVLAHSYHIWRSFSRTWHNFRGTTVMRYGLCHTVVCIAGLCRHVYKSHILGLAGSFSEGQLADLKRCLPDDCVDYVEEDVKVLPLLIPAVGLAAAHPALLHGCRQKLVCLSLHSLLGISPHKGKQ